MDVQTTVRLGLVNNLQIPSPYMFEYTKAGGTKDISYEKDDHSLNSAQEVFLLY